jgi:short-subunit dehydrogenase
VYNIVRLVSYCTCRQKLNYYPFSQASKGAVCSFYHSLRIELGDGIDITEIVLGVIESEITKGKILTEKGKIEVDQDLRDVSSL